MMFDSRPIFEPLLVRHFSVFSAGFGTACLVVVATFFLVVPELLAAQVARVPVTEVQKLPRPSDTDRFGANVDLSGEYAVVGSTDNVSVYRKASGSWQLEELLPEYGATIGSVALSGTTLAIGNRGRSPGGQTFAGSVLIYEKQPTGVWTQTAEIIAPDPQPRDFFGQAVDLNGDHLAVSAPGRDEGAIDAGAVYVFDRNAGGANEWQHVASLKAPSPQADEELGRYSVALSGNHLFVGSVRRDDVGPDAGAVYVFRRQGRSIGEWKYIKTLIASDESAADFFGHSVSAFGDFLLVGSLLADIPPDGWDAGAAYVFSRHEGGLDAWGEVDKLVSQDASINDELGIDVSLSGKLGIVGAWTENDDSFPEPTGAAFGFEATSMESWSETLELLPSDQFQLDKFGFYDLRDYGWSVAACRDEVLVGAPETDRTYGDGQGAVYHFRVPRKSLNYVALGDSYSSGEGAGHYEAESVENECRRSRQAWTTDTPGGVASSAAPSIHGTSVGRVSFACSGAKTQNLDLNIPDWKEEAQLTHDELRCADAVTATVGGNDAHFGLVVKYCYLGPNCMDARPWGTSGPTLEEEAFDSIDFLRHGQLSQSYGKIKDAAPSASIFVLEYPIPVAEVSYPPCASDLFSVPERLFMRSLAVQLNDAIRCAASEAGIHFVPTASHFRFHEACGLLTDWLTDVFRQGLLPKLNLHEPLHPNGIGQREMARRLQSYIGAQNLPPNPPSQPGACAASEGAASMSGAVSLPPSSLTSGSLSVLSSLAACRSGVVTVGSAVEVRGRGFSPGSRVDLTVVFPDYAETTVGSAVATATGLLDITTNLPSGLKQEGPVLLRALGYNRQGGAHVAVAPLTVSGLEDLDGDGVLDDCDNCRNMPNSSQRDADLDGLGDSCDPCPDDTGNDEDRDGLCSSNDTCPSDPWNDLDGDGVCGDVDNCPLESNATQDDSDGDGIGDRCEGIQADLSLEWSEPRPDIFAGAQNTLSLRMLTTESYSLDAVLLGLALDSGLGTTFSLANTCRPLVEKDPNATSVRCLMQTNRMDQFLDVALDIPSSVSGGHVQITATAVPPWHEQSVDNNTATIGLDILPPSADIRLAVVQAPQDATVGEPLDYSLAVTNAGPSLAGNLETNIQVEGGAILDVAASAGHCSFTGSVSRCSLDSLAADGGVDIDIRLISTTASSVILTAITESLVGDPDKINNSVSVTTGLKSAIAIPMASHQSLLLLISLLALAGATLLRREQKL